MPWRSFGPAFTVYKLHFKLIFLGPRNPFGSESDGEDEQGYPPIQSGYRVSPLQSFSSYHGGSSEALLGRPPSTHSSPAIGRTTGGGKVVVKV